MPCVLNEVMVSLDVRTQRCVFATEPCGVQGVCQEIHKGLHFFTSCACLGGKCCKLLCKCVSNPIKIQMYLYVFIF